MNLTVDQTSKFMMMNKSHAMLPRQSDKFFSSQSNRAHLKSSSLLCCRKQIGKALLERQSLYRERINKTLKNRKRKKKESLKVQRLKRFEIYLATDCFFSKIHEAHSSLASWRISSRFEVGWEKIAQEKRVCMKIGWHLWGFRLAESLVPFTSLYKPS